MTQNPLVLSLDGNIGAGKTTLMEAIRIAMPEVEVVVEPVGEWLSLKDANGKSLLELFYEDKRRWAYTFQNCAILTRLRTIKEAIATTKKQVILTERSVLTDRFVFAEMLRASGDITSLEWQLYSMWYDTFAAGLPMAGVIYLGTDVSTSAERIVHRGRTGEDQIPRTYLADLDAQHKKWLSSTALPVLSLESTAGLQEQVAEIRRFLSTIHT
jgi:deoxyadenosine/deoxycytidine kinase